MAQFSKMKIKKGDTVKILRGRDRGKTGKVLAAYPAEATLLVEGLNMVHKHVRPRRGGEKGQRVHVASPTRIANVQLICPSCKQATRVGIQRDAAARQRVCKKCQQII